MLHYVIYSYLYRLPSLSFFALVLDSYLCGDFLDIVHNGQTFNTFPNNKF